MWNVVLKKNNSGVNLYWQSVEFDVTDLIPLNLLSDLKEVYFVPKMGGQIGL